MDRNNREDGKNIFETVDREYPIPYEFLDQVKKEAKFYFISGIILFGILAGSGVLYNGFVHNSWSFPIDSWLAPIAFLWVVFYGLLPIWYRHMYVSYKRRKNAKFSCIAAFNSYALTISSKGKLGSISQIIGYHLDDTGKVIGLIDYGWERPINFPENSCIIIATSNSFSIIYTDKIIDNGLLYSDEVVDTMFSIDEFIEDLTPSASGFSFHEFEYASILEDDYFWETLKKITGLNYNEELLKKGQIALSIAKENKKQGLGENTTDNSQI